MFGTKCRIQPSPYQLVVVLENGLKFEDDDEDDYDYDFFGPNMKTAVSLAEIPMRHLTLATWTSRPPQQSPRRSVRGTARERSGSPLRMVSRNRPTPAPRHSQQGQ